MAKNPGIIYDLGENRWGVAYNKEQHENFTRFNRVYLHVFLDAECTKPEKDPGNGKDYVTLKHNTKIKPVGFID